MTLSRRRDLRTTTSFAFVSITPQSRHAMYEPCFRRDATKRLGRAVGSTKEAVLCSRDTVPGLDGSVWITAIPVTVELP